MEPGNIADDETTEQLPCSAWQPVPQYPSLFPQYPYSLQQSPNSEPMQVYPDVPPQIPLGETLLLVDALARGDAP